MAFDPYHKWLGIPPEQQPPNLYCLLGLPMFESDSDVIDAAAERQTIFLRTFQASDQAELAEKLLNEVSAARVCLLNPRDKGDYDQTLHRALTEKPMLKTPMQTDDSTSSKSRASASTIPGQSLHSKPTDVTKSPEAPATKRATDEDERRYGTAPLPGLETQSRHLAAARQHAKDVRRRFPVEKAVAAGVITLVLFFAFLGRGTILTWLSPAPNQINRPDRGGGGIQHPPEVSGETDNHAGIDQQATQNSETTTPANLAPQLSKLKNINGPGTDAHPWLSPDGLTIYWDRGDTIWTASRSSAGDDFREPRRLMPGRHPTLSGDQLELIVLAIDDNEQPLGLATRSSAEGSFGPVRVIEELRNQSHVKSPALSDDGLTLVFEQGIPPKEKRFVISRRNDRSARWSTPQLLPVDAGPYGDEPWTWAFLSPDSLTLFCCYGGVKLNRFLIGRRATAGETFADFQLVQVGNPAVEGHAPRYVKATNELFFSAVPSPESPDSEGDLWVIKNFYLPARR